MKNEELDSLIQKVIKSLEKGSPDTEEYVRATKVLKELYEIQSQANKSSNSLEILAIVVPALTSLLGIGLILFKEEYHPVISKALNFVYKGRFG